MRKLCAVILSAVVWQVAAATPASAAEHQSTLSAGYLHASTNAPGSDNLNGINVKYRYEFTDTLGLMTSFSYAGDKNRQLTRYSDTRWHEDSVRNRWFSVMSGFHEAELPLDDAKRVLHPGTDAGFHVFDVDGRFVLARILLQGFYLAGTFGDQPVHIHLGQLLALWRSLVAGIG